jgi:hypothetical protein
MVTAAQQYQVRERRGATLRPVMDVVCLPKTDAAAWEAAAAVAVLEGAAQCRRDRASSRANFHNPSVSVVPHDNPAGVARQALRRSSWNACAVLEHGSASCICVFQDFGIDVDDDLVALAWSARIELVTQSHLSDQFQGILITAPRHRRR